jgi:hypothetical protein
MRFMTSRHRSHPGYGNGPPRYPGTFLLAFRAAMAKLGWKTGRWLGDAVECTTPEGREQVVGLENLFRRARKTERAQWPELIADFLRTGQLGPVDDPPKDLAAVADQLLFRVGPPLAARGTQGPIVWQRAVEGTPLCLNLVIDFPQSMFYVTTDMVAQSGKPAEEWLELAMANMRKQTPAGGFAMLHEESGLRQSRVGDAYDSSRAMLLDSFLPEFSQHGFLVALPGRDELLVMPVTKTALQFLPLLKVVAQKNFGSAPYPISNEVYWIQHGRWHLFSIEMQEETAGIQPPEEFLPILKELLPEQGGGKEPDEAEGPAANSEEDA